MTGCATDNKTIIIEVERPDCHGDYRIDQLGNVIPLCSQEDSKGTLLVTVPFENVYDSLNVKCSLFALCVVLFADYGFTDIRSSFMRADVVKAAVTMTIEQDGVVMWFKDEVRPTVEKARECLTMCTVSGQTL